MEQLNRFLFLAINAPDPPSDITVSVAQFAAQRLVFLPIAIIAGLWIWGAPRGRGALLAAGLGLVIGMTINQVIGALWFHPRPFMVGIGIRSCPMHRKPRFRAITPPCSGVSGLG